MGRTFVGTAEVGKAIAVVAGGAVALSATRQVVDARAVGQRPPHLAVCRGEEKLPIFVTALNIGYHLSDKKPTLSDDNNCTHYRKHYGFVVHFSLRKDRSMFLTKRHRECDLNVTETDNSPDWSDQFLYGIVCSALRIMVACLTDRRKNQSEGLKILA